jgi:CelD/BcsL family acetyltransferase involved in cellulose biosynthesis
MARTPRPLIDAERFEALEPAWRALFAATPGAHPFCHPSWVRTWAGEAGPLDTVFLAVRLEDALIGVAPLELRAGSSRFLGDPNVFDYSPVLVASGREPAVARGILEWLGEDMTPALSAWGLAPGPFVDALCGAADMGWQAEVVPEAVAPAIECAEGFEAYVASLGKKDRHELRRKMRNFDAAGTPTFEVATKGPAFAAALENLIVLMRASHPGKVTFLELYEPFFRAAAQVMAEEGLACISTLSLDGRPAGATLTFEQGGCAYLYNSGYDPAFSHLAAGLVSKAWTIRAAIDRDIRHFDFLRGDEEYKRRLGGLEQPIVAVEAQRR